MRGRYARHCTRWTGAWNRAHDHSCVSSLISHPLTYSDRLALLHTLTYSSVVLVINRHDKLAQAVSLYRRRFDGKSGQFAAPRTAEHANAAAATRRAIEFADMNASSSAESDDGRAGNPWASTSIGSKGGTGSGSGSIVDSSASIISQRDLEKMLDHRESQVKAITCLAAFFDRPTLTVSYEGLRANFTAVMRSALAHLNITDGVDDVSLAALNEPGTAPHPPPAMPEPALSTGGSTSSVGESGSVLAFVKRSPSSLCRSVANLPALCSALHHSKYAPYVSDRVASGECTCAGSAAPSNDLIYSGGGSTSGGNGHAAMESVGGGGSSSLSAAHEDDDDEATHEAMADALFGRQHHHEPPPTLAVVGTHHKTGTVLMGQVLRVATNVLSAEHAALGSPTSIATATNPTATAHTTPSHVHAPTLATAPPELTRRNLPTSPHISPHPAQSPPELIRRNWTACVHAARRGGRVVCLLEHARWRPLHWYLERGLAFIHMVRDPIEVCVSGYQYHLITSEPWVLVPRPELGGRSWQGCAGHV